MPLSWPSISLLSQIPVDTLLQANAHIPGLTRRAKLRAGTPVDLPDADEEATTPTAADTTDLDLPEDTYCDVHSALNDETPAQIAAHYQVDLDELLRVNASRLSNLKAGSKLYAGTQIVIPMQMTPGEATRKRKMIRIKKCLSDEEAKSLQQPTELKKATTYYIKHADGAGSFTWYPGVLKSVRHGRGSQMMVQVEFNDGDKGEFEAPIAHFRTLVLKPPALQHPIKSEITNSEARSLQQPTELIVGSTYYIKHDNGDGSFTWYPGLLKALQHGRGSHVMVHVDFFDGDKGEFTTPLANFRVPIKREGMPRRANIDEAPSEGCEGGKDVELSCEVCGRTAEDFAQTGVAGLRAHIVHCKRRSSEGGSGFGKGTLIVSPKAPAEGHMMAEDEDDEPTCSYCGKTSADFTTGAAGLRAHIVHCRRRSSEGGDQKVLSEGNLMTEDVHIPQGKRRLSDGEGRRVSASGIASRAVKSASESDSWQTRSESESRRPSHTLHVEEWKTFGGTFVHRKRGKRIDRFYVLPDGSKSVRSWRQAELFMAKGVVDKSRSIPVSSSIAIGRSDNCTSENESNSSDEPQIRQLEDAASCKRQTLEPTGSTQPTSAAPPNKVCRHLFLRTEPSATLH
jgi:hypothetical protein